MMARVASYPYTQRGPNLLHNRFSRLLWAMDKLETEVRRLGELAARSY